MRLLHTSDWHVGRTFHGVDLLGDQARVLASIADIVAERGVDVVVVPGDIYDRAIPSAEAINVVNRALEAIRAAGAVIVATSGNHDSATRLGAGAAFARAGGLHLFTTLATLDQPYVHNDDAGPVAFYGLPYLEPEACRHELGITHAASHEAVLTVAMDRIRNDLSARPGHRGVVLAHAFVSGAQATGSERTIAVGGVQCVSAGVFDGLAYVALGHLHSPQLVTESVRYSGSPLPYSFGERSHRKAVLLVELDAAGCASVEQIDLPVVRELSVVEGVLADLVAEPGPAVDHYVSAVLTDAQRPLDAMRRLREVYPYAVHVEWRSPAASDRIDYRRRVRGRADGEIVDRFLTDVAGEALSADHEWIMRSLAAAARERDGATVGEQVPVFAGELSA